MDTVRELRRAVEDVTDDLSHQYGRRTPPCEVLHFELGLPQTRRDDADTLIENARKHDAEIAEDSVKLTIEHEDLHEALRLFAVNVMSQGLDAAQAVALMLVVGRRMGFQEAARLLGEEH